MQIDRRSVLKLIGLLPLSGSLAGRAIAMASFNEQDSEKPGRLSLWYGQAAKVWEEALPVGNGRLGAMVYGNPLAEELQLNEESVWAGSAHKRERPEGRKYLGKIRDLLFKGKYVEAEALTQDKIMSKRLAPRSHQTLGSLHIKRHTHKRAEITDYWRQLDLENGICETRFKLNGISHQQTVFASAPDNLIIVHLQSEKAGDISATFSLSRPANEKVTVKGDNGLALTGRTSNLKGEFPGVHFEGRLKVLNQGGTLSVKGNRLVLEGADKVTLLIAAGTDYRGQQAFQQIDTDLAAATKTPYQHLLNRHIADYRALADRMSLRIGDDRSLLPTDQRLESVKAGGNDPDLVALYFHYGRYLLMSCSRPGTMPANLQGIWNKHIDAPWNADYHININVQMNYWPAEVTNLSECHEPFFDLIDNLRERGRVTSKELYDCRGFSAGHTTDAWWFTVPTGEPWWGMWVCGAAWCCQHLWQRWLYDGDKQFLQQRAWPLMSEAALFFLDWLVEDPDTGLLVSGPATSPENTFLTEDGGKARISMGPAMDQQIIHELFSNTLAAAAILGIDDEFTRNVRDSLERLAPSKIGDDGRIMEWARPLQEEKPGHRHISHVYGVFPGQQFTWKKAPDFVRAARKTIEYRLKHGGGHTGWSRAWLIALWARLKDSAKVGEHMNLLLTKSTLNNLLDDHPPFQIDGNFGGTAAIAESLMQSHDGSIDLLPALPAEWPEGKIQGLRARGGYSLSITWQKGVLREAVIQARHAGEVTIAYGGKYKTVHLAQGEQQLITAQSFT